MSESPLTTVHLVRHGEVDNPTGVLYGRLPGFVLSPLGLAMADRVAEFLGDHDIAYVVASPLERAQQTAAPIAAASPAARPPCNVLRTTTAVVEPVVITRMIVEVKYATSRGSTASR